MKSKMLWLAAIALATPAFAADTAEVKPNSAPEAAPAAGSETPSVDASRSSEVPTDRPDAGMPSDPTLPGTEASPMPESPMPESTTPGETAASSDAEKKPESDEEKPAKPKKKKVRKPKNSEMKIRECKDPIVDTKANEQNAILKGSELGTGTSQAGEAAAPADGTPASDAMPAEAPAAEGSCAR
jgi:hypothetical protein